MANSSSISAHSFPAPADSGAAGLAGAVHGSGPVQGQRFDGLDIARGLSILLVVVMHSTLGVEHRLGQSGGFHALVAFATSFRVPAFFLLSGLFLASRLDEPLRRFFCHRVVGLAVIYLLWLVIHLGIRAAPEIRVAPREAIFGETGLLAEIMTGIIEPFGALWFIHLLMIFFIVARLTRKVPWPLLLAIGIGLETARIQTGWTAPDEFAARYLYFVAGIALGRALPIRGEGASLWARAASFSGSREALGLLGLWALVHGGLVAFGLDRLPGLSILAGFAGILAMILIGFRLASAVGMGAVARFLALCGRRSIVIYLVFTIPMALARGGLLSLIGPEARLSPFAIDGITALVILAALAAALGVERISRQGPLRHLFERPRFACG